MLFFHVFGSYFSLTLHLFHPNKSPKWHSLLFDIVMSLPWLHVNVCWSHFPEVWPILCWIQIRSQFLKYILHSLEIVLHLSDLKVRKLLQQNTFTKYMFIAKLTPAQITAKNVSFFSSTEIKVILNSVPCMHIGYGSLQVPEVWQVVELDPSSLYP